MSFFLKVLLRTREKSFWQPFQNFFSNSWILWLRDRKRSNNYISLQKTFKCSTGHIGCLFDKFAEIFTPKVEKFSSTRTKKLEQISFIPKKRPEVVPLKTLNVVLTILREFFCSMVQTSVLEVRKWFEKTFFLQIFSSNFFLY